MEMVGEKRPGWCRMSEPAALGANGGIGGVPWWAEARRDWIGDYLGLRCGEATCFWENTKHSNRPSTPPLHKWDAINARLA